MSYQAHPKRNAHNRWKDVRPKAEVIGSAGNRQNMDRALADIMDRHDCGSGSKDKRLTDKFSKQLNLNTGEAI